MNLPKHITDERTGLKYELIGDYYFIAVDDDELEDKRPIGRWGRMHEDFLKKNKRYIRIILKNIAGRKRRYF